MQYNERLDAELKALEGDMIETLQRWIRVPSVRAERSADNAPFGENVRRALDTAMADLKRLGMEPRDVDGYCCDTEIGQGDEVIAVLSHLDVVPEGEGWAHDPYGAEIIDGRMIGRGTSDDKGPGVAALFAMKAIMNAGIPLRRRCRLILGCDEECGMQDLVYYDRKIGLPERGFSPDANFPLINTEKGGLTMKLHAAVSDERLIEIASGTRVNVVPNQAVAVIAGDWREAAADAFDVEDEDCALESELVGGDTRLTVTGVSAHASVPEKGKNAAKMLVHVLAKLGIGGAPIALLDEAAGRESAGEDLGIAGSDKVSGALTINLGLLFAKAGKIDVTFDCRYPVFFNPETIGETVQHRLAPAGYALDPPEHAAPCSGIQRAGRQADGRLQHDQRRKRQAVRHRRRHLRAPSQGGRGLRHALPGRAGAGASGQREHRRGELRQGRAHLCLRHRRAVRLSGRKRHVVTL